MFRLSVVVVVLILTIEQGDCELERTEDDVTNNRYSGYALVRLETLTDMNQVDAVLMLRELNLEDERWRKIVFFDDVIIPRRRPVKLIISTAARESVETHLAEHGIKYTVLVEDIGRILNDDDDLNVRQKYRYNRQVDEFHGPLPPNHFMAYDDIIKRVNEWADMFENIGVKVFSIGRTSQNTETIAISINDDKDELAAVWIDGGIDSRVWLTTASVLYVALQMMKSTDPDIVNLRQSFRWYFVPTVNPDGYQYSMTEDRFWRKTRSVQDNGCYGVDINHNFNISFAGPGTSPDPCQDRYRGKEPFSEPESVNLRSALERCNGTPGGLMVYISFQGYGQYMFAPWTGRQMIKPENYDYLWVVAKEAMTAADSKEKIGEKDEAFRFGTRPDIAYMIRGSVQDYVREKLDVKWTFSVDVSPSVDSIRFPLGFNLPATVVHAGGQQAFAIVTTTVSAIQAGPTVDLLELYADRIKERQQQERSVKLKDEL